MDIFDFEELMAEILFITDEKREDDDFLPREFYCVFGFELEEGFKLAKELIYHTVPVEAGLSGKRYHAFVSKTDPVMLMKTEAK